MGLTFTSPQGLWRQYLPAVTSASGLFNVHSVPVLHGIVGQKRHYGNENVDVTVPEAVTWKWRTANHKLPGVCKHLPMSPEASQCQEYPEEGLAPLGSTLMLGGPSWPKPALFWDPHHGKVSLVSQLQSHT